MEFRVLFTPQEGNRLARSARLDIGLVGLARIREENPSVALGDVQCYVDSNYWTRVYAKLTEDVARVIGGPFLESWQAEVKVQSEPGELPLQHMVELAIPAAGKSLVWRLDPELVKVAWLADGAPLLWDPSKPDEEIFDKPDDPDTEFLRAQTMRKLQEFEPPAIDIILTCQRLYAQALVARLADDGSTDSWTRLLGPSAVRMIDERDRKIEKIKFLRNIICSHRSRLKETKDAIDARIAWLEAQKTAPWKDTLLNELSREDACIMGLVENALAAIPNDVDFDEVAPNSKVRDLIQYNEGWLSNRRNVVDALPPLWQKFFDSLE